MNELRNSSRGWCPWQTCVCGCASLGQPMGHTTPSHTGTHISNGLNERTPANGLVHANIAGCRPIGQPMPYYSHRHTYMEWLMTMNGWIQAIGESAVIVETRRISVCLMPPRLTETRRLHSHIQPYASYTAIYTHIELLMTKLPTCTCVDTSLNQGQNVACALVNREATLHSCK